MGCAVHIRSRLYHPKSRGTLVNVLHVGRHWTYIVDRISLIRSGLGNMVGRYGNQSHPMGTLSVVLDKPQFRKHSIGA